MMEAEQEYNEYPLTTLCCVYENINTWPETIPLNCKQSDVHYFDIL